ncbi:MAG: BrnA antitoxin family protein [Holophagales bacterium]|nr:BrnA antitoxin family protein [Holophagales bacterium]MYD20955.1 BrnA antitoxin family protein [Holophagales bacterium]MYI33286.1 BrnA antitoxin family protein [Holophagales bacterium]
MTANSRSTVPDSEQDIAPDLSRGEWPERFAKATVRRGRPPSANPKISTTIRLSREVVDHFKAGGRGWQTRIDAALREWIKRGDAA